MPTKEMVVGIAEVPVGAGRPARGHTHEPAEVYYIISGTGEVVVDGETYALRVGDPVGFRRMQNTRRITSATNR